MQHSGNLWAGLGRVLNFGQPGTVDLMGCKPVQRFPRPAIHQIGNRIELLLTVPRQVRALGQELANQVVGVFIGAALPRAVRIAEIHRNAGIGAELLVMGHRRAPVISQALMHRLGYGVELVGKSL